MSTVSEQMSHDVLAVSPDATLSAAAQTMMERSVGSAAVLAGGRLVGIITERDVLRSVALGLVPWTSRVSESMTGNPVTVTPGMSTEEAMRMMMTRGFRHLPVMEGDALLGLVSLRDLLRGRVDALEPVNIPNPDQP